MAVTVAVCEIFSVEKVVKVRSRSLEMAPFDRSHTSSYSPSIITLALSCIVCEIYLLVENREFFPHVYLAPQPGWPRRNFVKMFDADKTRMIGLPYGQKTMTLCYAVFIQYRTLWTDGRTDRQTDGQNCYINIARQSYIIVLTRDKNGSHVDTVPHVTIGPEKANHISRNVATIIFVKYLIDWVNRTSNLTVK